MAGDGWRAYSVAVVLLVGVLVGPGPVVPSHAAPRTDGDAYPLAVAATPDYGYQPDTFQQIPTNTNISVTFSDDDVLQHTFTVSSREGFVIPDSYTMSQLDQLFDRYPALVSLLVNPGGPPATGSFLSPAAPGWYEFVCNVSGHFQLGMYGFIAFGEALPANLTHVTPVGVGGAKINVAQAASIGALLLVLLVAFVLWRRGRSPRKSAPTRSGPSAPPAGPIRPPPGEGDYDAAPIRVASDLSGLSRDVPS